MKRFFGNVVAVIIGNILTFSLFGLALFVIVMFSMAGEMFNKKSTKDNSILELTFNAPIKESSMDEEFNLFAPSTEESVYFNTIIRAIQAAKEDDKIKGISLKVQSFNGGTSQLTDIRNALVDFKSEGKFIYAYSHNADQSAYILNSTADSIFQNPLGMVFFQGLSSEVLFYKNFGDKYGIDFQVIRHGAYKAAVEPYLRDDLSDENREQLDLLLGDIWAVYAKEIAQSRNMSVETLNQNVDSLFAFNPNTSLNAKLVDKIAHEKEYENALIQRLALDIKEKDIPYEVLAKHTVNLTDYAASLKNDNTKNQVAVLYASGVIMPGESYSGIQSEVYKKEIRKLANNDHVKAVVLRVNSPGGSADAAEEILQELKELHKKKPIIVSFGDVAASGGYYIAMAADSIFASPNTITGSIGVFGMVPNFKKLVNNLGFTTDVVNTNENADFLRTVFNPMSENGMGTMTQMTENVYSVFVQHVMAGRQMTYEEVDAVGGGRVWSGTAALERGLIDRFGTLEEAIQAAAQKANIEKYSVQSYPFRKGGIEEYLKGFQNVQSEAFIQQELGNDYFQMYKELKSMKEGQGIQVRMPFDIKIK